ncbi:MAG: lipid-A-disaccharide synthase [Kiritimatiellae bacterium]|nr:lipid-A-disaccharide synthase [Kiritimatiellia bacterium]
MKPPSIMIIAGEISGDMHAAALVRALRRRRPDIHCFGIGGENLRAAGMEIHYDVRDMAVLGLTEVLLRFRFFNRVFDEMLDLARKRRPDVILLVDYPGFNLRFAARVHALGFKVLYYICPQVWAWNRGRIPKMAQVVDRLLAIFPFEVDVFKESSLRVDFVGHPLVAQAAAARAEPPASLPWEGETRIALLPGSRYHEVKRILPVMWAAAARAQKLFPGAGFIIAAPSEEVAGWVRAVMGRLGKGPEHVSVVAGQTRQVLRQARAALVASGTATIETALMRCPMLVVYRVAWATYCMGRLLIRVPYLGMVNIVAGKRLCPEFIQHAARPEAMAAALAPLLRDGPEREKMLAGLDRVSQALGDPQAAEHAADIILQEL